jgi:hypothetical protein
MSETAENQNYPNYPPPSYKMYSQDKKIMDLRFIAYIYQPYEEALLNIYSDSLDFHVTYFSLKSSQYTVYDWRNISKTVWTTIKKRNLYKDG